MNNTLALKTKQLVDDLKSICANYGLGNDGNEYKIITELFLYKFMNDKFFYEIRRLDGCSAMTEERLSALSDEDYKMLFLQLPPSAARLNKEHYLSNLFNSNNTSQFAKLFDDTMKSLAALNADIFSVGTAGGEKVSLFNGISQYVTEDGKRDQFCCAIINKLFNCNFSEIGDIFSEKYDFFAVIFEYLIKDYNKNGGGKYAEYYTPHAVARIMSEILVAGEAADVLCYDPGAGTGSLLMSLAHRIGENRCTIYSQDISQKSSSLLRLNLILNELAHSLPNAVQGNTMTEPYHMRRKETEKGFDYIVSNPPFKLDFSDWRDSVAAEPPIVQDGKAEEQKRLNERFFAGVPAIPNKDRDKMAIYLLFIQHIISSLNERGKAAVVVPTGFLTEGKGKKTGIANKIRAHLVDNGWLRAVVSMPSNIFAATGTNVSVIFIDKTNKGGKVVLVDASALGTKVKEDKLQKTLLSASEEEKIINAVNKMADIDNFSVVKTFEELKEGKYSFNPGEYFEIKLEYSEITAEEFSEKVNESRVKLEGMFRESRELEKEIVKGLGILIYE
ncbi:MAG: type I restriction-modification system subunit M [Deferribacteraceae bacterium]|jgi:type I restriction enzyme M protein|nr:type I restriction-modification system subunit M [Deferribacteraceae bacterium]